MGIGPCSLQVSVDTASSLLPAEEQTTHVKVKCPTLTFASSVPIQPPTYTTPFFSVEMLKVGYELEPSFFSCGVRLSSTSVLLKAGRFNSDQYDPCLHFKINKNSKMI